MKDENTGSRWAALYLIALAIAVFLISDLRVLLGVFFVQLVVGLGVWRSAQPVLRSLRKLGVFSLLVIVSYAWVGTGAADDRTLALPIWPGTLSLDGLLYGLAMVLRIFSVVYASGWVRVVAGPRGFALGLSSLGLPNSFAELLDGTLALVEGNSNLRGGGGRGRGGGGGGGRGRGGGGGGRRREREEAAEPSIEIRRLLKGDTDIFVDLVERSIRRARQSDRPADYSLLSGLLVLMLSIKALKIVPGLPFAPGHKGVVLIPTYLVAAALTTQRFGAILAVAHEETDCPKGTPEKRG
ncbi:MAG: energy-coupling factor transporter transmembrane component T, partial [Myxococcota bacterium]